MNKPEHALVIGASIAGLTAAKALTDSFARVTIVERDVLPDVPDFRRGVPQGKHLHGLLAGGSAALEKLFPGFGDGLVAAGGIRADMQSKVNWCIDGRLLKPEPSGIFGIASSRPLLESELRKRVSALPGVEIVDNCEVLELVPSGDRRRVTGVSTRSRTDGSEAVRRDAALVVDASGRASRTPVWLQELGYERARETRMDVDTTYVTRSYQREPHHLGGRAGINASPFPGSPRSAFVLRQENDRFVLTTAGVFGEQPPMDDEGLLEFAESLPAKEFTDFLRTATRVGEPVKMRYPASVRRHYEKLTRFPGGYLVVGDAICSFNPVYGQGMTIAAAEAVLVRDLLATGPDDLARRFFRAAAKLVETAWTTSSGSDLRLLKPAAAPLRDRLLNRYLERLYRVAAHDAVVAKAFIRVINLLDTPEKLLAPSIVRRVFRRLPGTGR